MNIYIVKATGWAVCEKSYNVKAFSENEAACTFADDLNRAIRAHDYHFSFSPVSITLAEAGYDGLDAYMSCREMLRPDFITNLDPFYRAGDLQRIEYKVEEMELL